MADAQRLARGLAQRLAAIADPDLRVRYLARTLEDLPAVRIAELLSVAVHGAEARDPQLGELLLALCLALSQEGREALRAEVARAAIERGRHAAAELIGASHAAREREEPFDVPDFGVGRPVSLGERKSLARRRDRDLLARVLRDPDPAVIRILMGNPALTEDDVVRLCSTRPVAAEVLREVFRTPRWVVRYRVRRALVRNPYTPLDVSLPLATLLHRQDAVEVARSPELAELVRDRCRRVARLVTVH